MEQNEMMVTIPLRRFEELLGVEARGKAALDFVRLEQYPSQKQLLCIMGEAAGASVMRLGDMDENRESNRN